MNSKILLETFTLYDECWSLVDEGSTSLRNVGELLSVYMASHARRQILLSRALCTVRKSNMKKPIEFKVRPSRWLSNPDFFVRILNQKNEVRISNSFAFSPDTSFACFFSCLKSTFSWVSCHFATAAYSSTLWMEVVPFIETSVNFYKIIRRHMPETSTLHCVILSSDNLKRKPSSLTRTGIGFKRSVPASHTLYSRVLSSSI